MKHLLAYLYTTRDIGLKLDPRETFDPPTLQLQLASDYVLIRFERAVLFLDRSIDPVIIVYCV